MAAQLVGQLGAADTLLSLEAAVMPGGGNLVAKVFADQISRDKAETLLATAADRAACMVLEHRDALVALADALCVNDELSGEDVSRIVTASLPA
jgi:hypothetical protein